ncbi:MAG: hypothetical protein SH847_16315 [Roseiflexaceae bacterium]|nr:hypothetical protein [Roseiflexaceae bacterium]
MSTTFPAETLVCQLDAIAEDNRTPHMALATQLIFHMAQERVELADGYAFRFPAEDYPALVAFIGNERLCCAFFRFELIVEPQHGPVWLRLCGTPDVKAYLAEQLESHTLRPGATEETNA